MKDFVRSLDPFARLPTRNTLKRKLDELYFNCKDMINKEMDNAITICICVDGWSDPNRVSMQGVYAYGVNQEYKLFARTVDLQETGHGSSSLSDLIRSICQKSSNENDCPCESRSVNAVVTDSTGANPLGVRLAFSERIQERRITDSDFFWWPCLAHRANLCEKWATKRMLGGDFAGSNARLTDRELTERSNSDSSDIDLAVREAKEEGTVFEHLSAERLEEELSTILCQRDQDSNPLSFAYLIEKVKLCARAIRQSDTRASFYKKIASSRVPPVTRKIKSSTRTRFSSQLAQFESILENHSVLKCMADDPSKIWPSNLYFNGDEIQQIQCLVETMKPMEELISIFSMTPAKHGLLWGVGVPVIHAAMSHYQGLRANDECNAMNRNLAGLLHEELEGYIGSLVFSAKRLDPTLYEIAALLDPRCVLWLLRQEFHTLEQYQTKLRNTEIWLLGLPPWDEKERVSPNPVTEISTSKFSLLDVAIRGCISAASSEGAVAPSGRTGRGGGMDGFVHKCKMSYVSFRKKLHRIRNLPRWTDLKLWISGSQNLESGQDYRALLFTLQQYPWVQSMLSECFPVLATISDL